MPSPPTSAWTSAECTQFDQSLQALGLPSICLMEQAANAICGMVESTLKPIANNTVAFLCGPGNNGADGVAAARLSLGNPDLEVYVLLLSDTIAPKSLLETHLKVFKSLGGKVHVGIENWPELVQICPDLWVDALFGVGLMRPIEGPLSNFIASQILHNAPILAVDCPSGLDATSGKILGTAIPATWTLSFVAPKTGFNLHHGPEYCGEVLVADIGVRGEIAKAWKANGGSFPGPIKKGLP